MSLADRRKVLLNVPGGGVLCTFCCVFFFLILKEASEMQWVSCPIHRQETERQECLTLASQAARKLGFELGLCCLYFLLLSSVLVYTHTGIHSKTHKVWCSSFVSSFAVECNIEAWREIVSITFTVGSIF